MSTIHSLSSVTIEIFFNFKNTNLDINNTENIINRTFTLRLSQYELEDSPKWTYSSIDKSYNKDMNKIENIYNRINYTLEEIDSISNKILNTYIINQPSVITNNLLDETAIQNYQFSNESITTNKIKNFEIDNNKFGNNSVNNNHIYNISGVSLENNIFSSGFLPDHLITKNKFSVSLGDLPVGALVTFPSEANILDSYIVSSGQMVSLNSYPALELKYNFPKTPTAVQVPMVSQSQGITWLSNSNPSDIWYFQIFNILEPFYLNKIKLYGEVDQYGDVLYANIRNAQNNSTLITGSVGHLASYSKIVNSISYGWIEITNRIGTSDKLLLPVGYYAFQVKLSEDYRIRIYTDNLIENYSGYMGNTGNNPNNNASYQPISNVINFYLEGYRQEEYENQNKYFLPNPEQLFLNTNYYIKIE